MNPVEWERRKLSELEGRVGTTEAKNTRKLKHTEGTFMECEKYQILELQTQMKEKNPKSMALSRSSNGL